MQAAQPDVFALRNSGLDAFLYADVGAELNGSALTILSMIARLGRDPWAEAARWAALPRADAIESLAQNIAEMPLTPAGLVEARVIAARLVQLLPGAAPEVRPGAATIAAAASELGWLPITILYCAMAAGMALSAHVVSQSAQAVATPAGQPMAVPAPAGPGTR